MLDYFVNIILQYHVITFITENYQSQDQVSNIFSPSNLTEILGSPDFRLLKIIKTVQMSPSILKIQRRQSTFWKAHQTFNLFLMHFMSFINYQKSKMIFKSSLFLNPSIISSIFCVTITLQRTWIFRPSYMEWKEWKFNFKITFQECMAIFRNPIQLHSGRNF